MELNLRRFFRASNPAKTLNFGTIEDRQYYIDFSEVRGGKLIEQVARTITRLSPENPTCQLFTGHIGSGKSTELLRLKAELEEQDFHVVYFESSKDLDMADVDITDILLAIARQVSESIEQLQITLQPTRFKALLQGLANVLQAQIDIQADLPALGSVSGNTKEEFSLSLGIGKITAKARDSRDLRTRLRQYLEPRTNTILQAINQELLTPSIEQLKQQGKQGLVVIIDNLDRIMSSRTATGRPQPEYLFIDRGDQLNQLGCHVVYTIPLGLIFSNDLGRLTNRFGGDPKTLPMVPVRFTDETPCEEGIELLRQMVMARSFPEVKPDEYSSLIPQVFDQPETLERLCMMSGGHVRTLLVLLYSCLQKEDPPLSREALEDVILQRRHQLLLAIEANEWEMLRQVGKTKKLSGLTDYQTLLRSLWVFEYRYRKDFWFDVNPILVEAPEFQS
ncbi:archaeal ATPase family protein [Lyngbya aestuarii BL J]|uniref:Archaeal ATPase family protein n=1 Tax=Lyngbya aestuarii BL J TaxID=1348334 RepID=U7QCG8_9CYAN|nr:P-loop NTPase fold protein [Lyngbya aestuarii]ERT05528.1 archaeal ATPase family protein [Lyngbya aestuarii BL J]